MISRDLEMPSNAVMLVDDERDIVLIFKRFLEASRYEVSGFVDPLMALEHLESNKGKYGPIISDIRMPGLSGVEFAMQVRGLDASIPTILMSAFEMALNDISPALNISSFLKKPISQKALTEIVARCIRVAAN